ncbi:uncharacterized protein LOC117304786 [Asterias rubens]|uniref:uncharacterized protein LOC117304786 n=1 Tax=Asterias rubens TaxID=7604 RepID=UPI00145574FB|nr:uncharacterized protein LOC117304786 [Asterias rubens]
MAATPSPPKLSFNPFMAQFTLPDEVTPSPVLGQHPTAVIGDLHSTPKHQAATVSPLLHPSNILEMCDFDPSPTRCQPPAETPQIQSAITTHQVKGVVTFTGKEKGPKVEDWLRDMQYVLESKGRMTDRAQLHDIVRHTSGRARDVILNLESRTPTRVTAEMAFAELVEEFGEDTVANSPITRFYSRTQKSGETASDFAITLEALLRRVEVTCTHNGRQDAVFGDNRDSMLATQFMAGLRDRRLHQRLAPMRPRSMRFKDIRQELRVIAEDNLMEAEPQRQAPPQQKAGCFNCGELGHFARRCPYNNLRQQPRFQQTSGAPSYNHHLN